ncbi:MAG: Phage tail tube protein FII-like protein [Candidatus Saccharibacteria bacterium]|nr:Phage tail tube protein FII-like protein [Candidatus Saccharibacteria bacterium]
MSNNLYTMEAANLVCGDGGSGANPGVSTHLQILELKLPGLEEAYVDVMPGGAPVGIEVPMSINKLESTFNLAGWNPDVMVMQGRSEKRNQVFTAYGLIRERSSGAALQAMAIMWGRLGRVNPTNFRKGDLNAHEFSIRSIVHYELYMEQRGAAGQGFGSQGNRNLREIFYWDFFTSERRVDGVERNADLINILAIPGAAA